MDYEIKAIALPEEANQPLSEEFRKYSIFPECSDAQRALRNLSKINIFVGENNSGKSKFLRHLAAIENVRFVPNIAFTGEWTWEIVSKVTVQFFDSVLAAFRSGGMEDADGLVAALNALPKTGFVLEGSTPYRQILTYAERLKGVREFGSVRYRGGYNAEAVLRALKQALETWQGNLANLPNLSTVGESRFDKLYIPTLRSLRALSHEQQSDGYAKDLFQERTTADYFSDGKKPDVFTGQTLYNEVQCRLLGDLKQRKAIREFERFLSQSFYHGEPVALIPKLRPQALYIKIGKEAERPIHLLGDGIQSIIILTFPLFANQEKHLLVFLEEPELYLHPGLQRILLNALTTFKNHQYFLTTHSNHLLDLTLDFPSVSIFTFRKTFEGTDSEEQEARFQVENVSSEDRRSLELLGVRNSSVLLSNCTIWVEGITDRRYYQKFLELYLQHHKLKAFKEDLHYSFVEYGGSCISHWSFLDTDQGIDVERLCGRLMLIADGDTATSWKTERHKKLEAKLGDRYCRLSCKEVENLLSPAVLLKVLTAYGETDISEFEYKDYCTQPLGIFLEKTALKGNRKRQGTYLDGGTISDKVGFCGKAMDAAKSFSDLSKEAKAIAERLYEFIAAHNK